MKNLMITTILSAGLAAAAFAGDTGSFGAALQGGKADDLAQVLAKPEAGKKVRLEGTVKAVCQNKGCWLELGQGDKAVHVTFRDYGFFVPKSCAGKKVVLEGEVKVEEPKKETVEHLKAEGASDAVASNVSVVATGVSIE